MFSPSLCYNTRWIENLAWLFWRPLERGLTEKAITAERKGLQMLIKKRLVKTSAVFAMVALLAGVSWGDVVWTLEDGVGRGSGEGAYTLDAAVEASSLVISPTASLSLMGPGLAFTSSEATVSVTRPNRVALDLPITASGALAFLSDTDVADILESTTGYLKAVNTVLFPGVSLDEYSVYSAVGGGLSLTVGTELTPFHFERGSGWQTVQFQAINGGWAKCVKVRLEQQGADVVGRIVYAKYLPTSNFGADFDDQGNTFSISTADDSYGYGIKVLRLRLGVLSGMDIVATKPIRLGDGAALTVDSGVSLTVDGEEVLADGGRLSNPASVSGRLVVTNATKIVFDGGLSGSRGEIEVGGLVKTVSQAEPQMTYDLPMPTSWTVVATNATLAFMTNVYVNAFAGMAIKNTPGAPIYHFVNDGLSATGQCQQVDGNWIKCVYLLLRQSGDDIEGCIASACYTAASTGVGVDFNTLPLTGAGQNSRASYSTGSASNAYAYGLGSFTMFFDVDRPPIQENLSNAVQIEFNGENTMTDARVVQHGGQAKVTHLDGLPKTGTYLVDGGILSLEATGCTIPRGLSKGNTAITVRNGMLVQARPNVLDGTRQFITLDASELRLLPDMSSGRNDLQDSDTYVNHLKLLNGSCVTRKYPRIAYNANAEWVVDGSAASWCEKPLLQAASYNLTFTMTVADVTGDADVDLDLRGGIVTYNDEHRLTTSIKRGAGTVRLGGESFWHQPLELKEGTVLLGVSGVLAERYSVPFALMGGTLATADATTNVAGAVTLHANSSIALGTASSLSMAAPTEEDWASGCTLAVSGPEVRGGARIGLRVGTTACLSSSQLSALTYNGARVQQDAEGYICTLGRGSCVIIR